MIYCGAVVVDSIWFSCTRQSGNSGVDREDAFVYNRFLFQFSAFMSSV